MSRKILIVDDEQHILDTLGAYLRQEGFQVISARDGRTALFTFRHEQPDLVILDVMMPDMDGWETARLLRKEAGVPLIFLTARIEDADQVAGLELGADEYITKPFSPRVVVARVRALLRRIYGELASEPYTFRIGQIELNVETRMVTAHGQRIDLTPTEFTLLHTLMTRPGRVFTRMELLDQLSGDAFAGYERTIDVHIKNLRMKLGDDSRQPRYIETVFGIGYRMNPDDE